MKTIRFGIIGCGLMGREFASATLRWAHLPDMDVRPEIVALCDRAPGMMDWFKAAIPTITQTTEDYKELLANPDVDAVYIAVPHNLHQELYCATIEAGKHLFGEKPFGIDLEANKAISECIKAHPEVFVRCCSQFPFAPAMQRIGDMLDAGVFGTILEAESGFLHSSDLNPDKALNWKRMVSMNGRYGCLGDLGMHACHAPFRAGWIPKNVRAVLSNVVTERPDGKGGRAACETWDNATLLCETTDTATGQVFPWTFKTFRIAPGEKNTWYFRILGTRASARFSSKNINSIEVLEYTGGEQAWQTIDMGHEVAFKSITGGIFEMGFSDLILQMWAGYLYELTNGKPLKRFAGCVTPDEVALSHRLFTAALESQDAGTTVEV